MQTSINQFFKRLLELPWTYSQPVTHRPKEREAVISDLFFWIQDEEFEVFFELLDLVNLFGDIQQSGVEIVFFDKAGGELFVKRIDAINGYRQRLNITEILKDNLNFFTQGDYGTFAIFHLSSPDIVREMNSFVAERGYVSYRYKKSPISSYVHGNFDAIGKVGKDYIPLGGDSFFTRIYNLQYQFLTKKKYRIFLTNPCKKMKKISIKIISLIDGKKLRVIEFKVNSSATVFCDLDSEVEPFKISIESRMIIARPVIFAFDSNHLDVFHG